MGFVGGGGKFSFGRLFIEVALIVSAGVGEELEEERVSGRGLRWGLWVVAESSALEGFSL